MSAIGRGVRNSFRNVLRTFSIVIILGLSIGLALTMLIAHQAVGSRIDSVKSSIANTITVTPAGERGFAGGGNPLTSANVNQIKSTAHVTSVSASLSDRLSTQGSVTPNFGGNPTSSTNMTNLSSPIDAGSLGRRFGGNNPNAANFSLPIMVTGTSTPTSTQVSGSNRLNITSGSTIDGNSSQDVALVGKDLASKNSLDTGSTFQAYGKTITVAGIYDAGNTFANAGIIMPLATVQTLSGQTGDVTNVIVQVDSISDVSSTVSSLQSALGSAADVVSTQDSANQALAPLENIQNISLVSLIGAIVAGSIIILLTMLMIVRERRREIGVLKAIGSSNLKVVVQFISEAITFTMLGAAVGLGLGIVGANPITQLLVNNSSSSSTTGPGGFSGGGGFGGGGGGTRFVRILGQSGNSLRNIHANVGWSVLLYGLAAAVVIAIVGSTLPAWLIARVRPAEVMRTE